MFSLRLVFNKWLHIKIMSGCVYQNRGRPKHGWLHSNSHTRTDTFSTFSKPSQLHRLELRPLFLPSAEGDALKQTDKAKVSG